MDKQLETEHGAFMEKFTLEPLHLHPPNSSDRQLPLDGLTFAVKDIFDVEGHVTGFGNPDWLRTHPAANSTAPTVLALLKAGATCVGKTVMDELAYSINGENIHYGTPRNPCAPDRVPGGSSSGSAVAVGAKLVDLSLGTDTGGSVRVPASFCGIYGFRPSHGIVSVDGVTPMAQSFDTVGWFARDPHILNKVGRVLLPLPDIEPAEPSQIIMADDCFELLSVPINRVKGVLVQAVEKLYGGHVIKDLNLGEYIKENAPSLKQFMNQGDDNKGYSIPSLVALSSVLRSLQRHEFKKNHGEWLSSVKPNLGPGIAERAWEAVRTTGENISVYQSVKTELRDALTSLLGDYGVLVIPTVPGPPPKIGTEVTNLEAFRVRAFSLLSIAGVSGFCQVSIPLGLNDNLPVSVSLLVKHGSDKYLLNLVESLHGTLEEQISIA